MPTLIAIVFLSVLAFMAHRSLENLRQRRWEWVASDASEACAAVWVEHISLDLSREYVLTADREWVGVS